MKIKTSKYRGCCENSAKRKYVAINTFVKISNQEPTFVIYGTIKN